MDPATGLPTRGNIAETFEFRAVDRNLHTPYVQQYNFGVQRDLGRNMVLEVRYVGSKGTDLLEALAFNQGYDLNSTDTPDHIFERFNLAYVASGSPQGPLKAGATARERGVGLAFGFPNASLGGALDYNLSNSAGAVIGFEARTPVLGFNVPEAVLLGNTGRSLYNSLQVGLSKRMSDGLQFNFAYTYSRSKDTSSADPGSTAGGGKPDTPNTGFVVQGDNRNVDANYALSDFDRPHRFSGSWIWSCRSEEPSSATSASRGSCRSSRVCRIRSTRSNRSSAIRRRTGPDSRLRRSVPSGFRASQPVRIAG